MLSGETSVGRYPTEAVRTMARIIEAVERETLVDLAPGQPKPRTMAGAICLAAARVGEAIGATSLVAFTETGASARRLARYRSPIPLLAFTPTPVRAQPAGAVLGGRDVPGPVGDAHRRHGAAGRHRAAGHRPLLRSGTTWSSSPARRPASRGRTNALRVHKMGNAVKGVSRAYTDRADRLTGGQSVTARRASASSTPQVMNCSTRAVGDVS